MLHRGGLPVGVGVGEEKACGYSWVAKMVAWWVVVVVQ